MSTASEKADPNADGDPRDAVNGGHDGEPDHLDSAVTVDSDGTVGSEQKMSSTSGGLTPGLGNGDEFGPAPAVPAGLTLSSPTRP